MNLNYRAEGAFSKGPLSYRHHFLDCPGVVVGVRFARAVWCNIRGACHHSRAFSFQEVHHFGGLGLGFEGIRRPGPASGVDRPRPVVTDARI